MRKLLLISFLFLSLFVEAQVSFTPGQHSTITIGGRQYKLFTPPDYETCPDSLLHFFVHFYGNGEMTAASTDNKVLGKYVKAGGPWNDGRVVKSNGDTARVIVLSIPNYTEIPEDYAVVVNTVINSLTRLDKTKPSRFAIMGFSGGPGRFMNMYLNSAFDSLRPLFKKGLFISPTWITPPSWTWSSGGHWWVFYADKDPNSGTPPGAATSFYSNLQGNKKITALDYNKHDDYIWDSAFSIAGVKDSYKGDLIHNSTNNRIRFLVDPFDDGDDPSPPHPWDTSIYYPIIIDTNFNLGNISYKKTPQAWFDNSTNASSRLDKQGGQKAEFVTPYHFIVELKDSAFGNFSFRYYNGFTTGPITINLYDSLKNQIGTKNFSRDYNNGGEGSWSAWDNTFKMLTTPIRFVEFFVSQPANTDLREMQFRGLAITRNTPVAPPPSAPTVRADPRELFVGISSIDDRDTNYMKKSNGEAFFGTYRQPMNVFMSAYDISKTRFYQPYAFHFFGDLAARKLNFMKNKGVETQLYYNGGWLGALGNGQDSTAGYNLNSNANKYKDIDRGADSTNYNSWLGYAKLKKAIAYLWGNNQSAWLDSSYRIYKTADLSPGQNKVKVLEIGNEDNQDWNGFTAYHSPLVARAKLSAAYDSIKSVDPSIEVYAGATFFADTAYWKALYWSNYWIDGERSIPADGFAFNQYLSSAYGGQPKEFDVTVAVTPEQFKMKELTEGLRNFRDRWAPGRGLRLTEFGFARAGTTSNYRVKNIPSIPDTVLVANLIVRTLERAAMVENGLDRAYHYFYTTDNSTEFGSMILTLPIHEDPSNAYLYSRRQSSWYWLATRFEIMKGFPAWSQTIIDGDSTNVTITKRKHLTENKDLFYYTLGTYNGETRPNQTFNVGSNAKSVKLIEFLHGEENGVESTLTITEGNISLPVDEFPRYFVVEYKDSEISDKFIRKTGAKLFKKNANE